jgi:hypothetical protein
MKRIDFNLLNAWNGLWQCPDVLTALAANTSQLDSYEVAHDLLRSIAAAESPLDSLKRLIDDEQFRAATLLLSNLEQNDTTSEGELKKMKLQLAGARERSAGAIEVRKFILGTRAIAAGLGIDRHAALAKVDDGPKSAKAELDEWELKILSKELQLQEIVRARFEDARSNIIASKDVKDVWEKSLVLCIEMCRFKEADKLLEQGPRAISGKRLHPIEVPRRPVWPYTFAGIDILSMFLSHRQSENEITKEWGPAHDDHAARELLETLAPLVKTSEPARRHEVSDFVEALDVFLGGPKREHRVTHESNNSFSSVLHSLNDVYVPRLALCGESVPIWFPRDATTEIPQHLDEAPVVIAFHPSWEPKDGPRVLTFTSTLLFRLAGDPNRRINFIRWLGRQIRTEDIMSGMLDLKRLPSDEDGIRQYTTWLFDCHGIPVTSHSVLDLIAFYSASSPYILRALLSEIGGQIYERDGGVKVEHVHEAWKSKTFRNLAIAHCLSSLGADPWPLAVLACVYITAAPEEEVSAEYINEWLRAFNYSGNHDVMAAFQRLIASGLLAVGHAPDSVRTPRSAPTLLIREHFGDIEQFLNEQLRLLSENPRP